MFSTRFLSLFGAGRAARRNRPVPRLHLERLEDRTLLSTGVYSIPTGAPNPRSLTEGPDGNVWFTEYQGNQIARLTPSGVLTEFALPQPNSLPHDITVGPDNMLWFSEPGVNKIARMDLNGVVLNQ
jgi:streptogramin lyase